MVLKEDDNIKLNTGHKSDIMMIVEAADTHIGSFVNIPVTKHRDETMTTDKGANCQRQLKTVLDGYEPNN